MKAAILIGDSIRMGYEGFVRDALAGTADVWAPEENGGTSRNVLAHLDEWVLSRAPDVVHLNCGLHDLRRDFGAKETAVPLTEYRRNVEQLMRSVLDGTDAAVIWATTTPVNEEWHHRNKEFDRLEADVIAYNEAAAEVCERLGVAVHDLYGVVMAAGRDGLLSPDGVHFKEEGYQVLGHAVARAIRDHL